LLKESSGWGFAKFNQQCLRRGDFIKNLTKLEQAKFTFNIYGDAAYFFRKNRQHLDGYPILVWLMFQESAHFQSRFRKGAEKAFEPFDRHCLVTILLKPSTET